MDASSPMMQMSAESPLGAESSEGSPKDWWSGGGSDMAQELNSIHAANATCAAFHADVAAKHAASLAQWVQYLWGEIAQLQKKVFELEDWKKKTIDDTTKLRFEHKILRRSLMPGDQEEDDAGLPGKSRSLPIMLADHVDAGDASAKAAQRKSGKALTEGPKDGAAGPGGRSVRFAEHQAPQSPACPAPPPTLPVGPVEAVSPQQSMDRSVSAASALSSVASELSPLPSDVSNKSLDGDGAPEGVRVTPSCVDGAECEIAEWRIGHLSSKLRGCMGRALVSPPFSARGLDDLRLMVFPDGQEAARGPRSRKQKELYQKKVNEGPLDACLKLKVPSCPAPHIVEYYLKIGSVRAGPFRHNFTENAVNGCSDFGIDWLKQVDLDSSLTVTVEILTAPGEEASATVAADGGASP